MRTLKGILLVTAVAAIGATLPTKAGEPVYPPKTAEQMDSLQEVSTRTHVDLTKNLPNGSAKAWDVDQSLRQVPVTGSDIDLAHAPRPNLPLKSPNYDYAWRQNAIQGTYVASTR